LSSPTTLLSFDLSAKPEHQTAEVPVLAVASGSCHALVLWIDYDLTASNADCNANSGMKQSATGNTSSCSSSKIVSTGPALLQVISSAGKKRKRNSHSRNEQQGACSTYFQGIRLIPSRTGCTALQEGTAVTVIASLDPTVMELDAHAMLPTF